MSLIFPGESAEYRRRVTGCWSRRSSCVARWRRWPPRGRAAARRRLRGLRLPGQGRGRQPRRRADVGAVRACQGLAGDLQLHVPAGLRGDRPGPRAGDGAPATRGGPLPVLRGTSRSARRRRGTRQSADQLRSGGENAVVAAPHLGRGARLAEAGGSSSAANTYNRDYFGEAADGSQFPMLNVFHRDGGTIRHFWGAELTFAPADPGQDHRSVGTLEPLEPVRPHARGRPDWDERLSC